MYIVELEKGVWLAKWCLLILIQLIGTGFAITQGFGISDYYDLTKRRANDSDYLMQYKYWKLQEWSEFYFTVIIGYFIFIAMIVVPIFYYGWANT